MLYINNFILSEDKQEILFNTLKELVNEIHIRLNKLLINVTYNWNDNLSIIECYENINDFLIKYLDSSLKKINYYFITNKKEYSKEKVYDHIIIVGSSIYFLDKLVNSLTTFQSHKIIYDLNFENNKLLYSFKKNLYNRIDNIFIEFILYNINKKEDQMEVERLYTECKSLLLLFNICHIKLHTLDVYSFLV